MSKSSFLPIVAICCFVLSCGVPAGNAAEPQRLQKKSYDVRPLLVNATTADQLMDNIHLLFPESWDVVGGSASQKITPNGRLEVLQTEEAHQVIALFLRSLTQIPAQRRVAIQQGRDRFLVIGNGGGIDDNGKRFTTVVYDVADVVNFADGGVGTTILWLEERIAPDSWASVGGSGLSNAFPASQVFVISQSEEVHREIQAFLKGKRAGQR
jgi:hypothetical protein